LHFRAALLASALLLGSAAASARSQEDHADEPITPIPTTVAARPDKVSLGERLFNDVRLSRSATVACGTCHRLDAGGADNQAVATGLDGQPLDFNTPSIFNVALDALLDWRGNYRSIEAQNAAVLRDAHIMDTDWASLLAALRADAAYRAGFSAIYRAEPGHDEVIDALAAYQRSLLTPNSRFDRYLRGEPHALSTEEQHGYELFKSYGCVACHQGVNVGGNLYQRFGVFADPFAGRPERRADLGRFVLTGDPADRHVFRVPSLRNVALTAPYFHDGSAPSLSDAVTVMARSQLGRTLPRTDTALIVAFLRTLTGELRGHRLSETGR
jgi:cytochrome c peroxidase